MSLNTNALIAHLSVKMLGNARKDEQLTADVHDRHHMATDAGRYQKCLLPEACLSPHRKIVSAARGEHRQLTLMTPLGPLLPASKTAEAMTCIRRYEKSWDDATRRFIRDYHTNIGIARRKLAAAFDESDYPTLAELPGIFQFTFSLTPLPRAEMLDEITGLADAQIHDLRRQLNESTARAAQAARDDLMQRILFRLGNLSRCLSNPDAQVRQRTVESLTELLDSAAAYNLTNDASITRLVADCRRELTLATEVLREDDTARRRSATAAQMILAPYSRKIAA